MQITYENEFTSCLGQRIPVWKSLKDTSNSRILVLGGVHGDEIEGIELANLTIKTFLQTCPISNFIVIPCLNVDGYLLNQRENFRGVDLNRNLPSKNWNSIPTNSRYNPGEYPESENENKLFMSIIRKFQPHIIISCHSYTKTLLLVNHGKVDFNNEIEELGTSMGVPIVKAMGYPALGSLNSYSRDFDITTVTIEAPKGIEWHQTKEHFSKCYLKFIERIDAK